MGGATSGGATSVTNADAWSRVEHSFSGRGLLRGWTSVDTNSAHFSERPHALPATAKLSARHLCSVRALRASSCAHQASFKSIPRTYLAMAGKGSECLHLSDHQLRLLEENFTKVSKHPDNTTLMLIAAECGLTEEDTQVRRAQLPLTQTE